MRKYSIILPVRNGGEYVKDCVKSILAQSYREFNLIVLDNYSTDGTPEWIRSLGESRIEIFLSDRPLTIEENWGRITGIGKNEFITLIGHDDLLYRHYLDVMNSLIVKYPDATLYQSHFNFIDAAGKEIRKCLPMDVRQTGPEFLSDILSDEIDIMGTGYMMRAKDYDAVGGIPRYPNLLFADFTLWTELTRMNYKATSFDESFSFRKHLSTTSISPDTKMQQAFGMFIDFLVMLKKTDKELNNVIERYGINFIKKNCKGSGSSIIAHTKKQTREFVSCDLCT